MGDLSSAEELGKEVKLHEVTGRSWTELLEHARRSRLQTRQTFVHCAFSQVCIRERAPSTARLYTLGPISIGTQNLLSTAHKQTLFYADLDMEHDDNGVVEKRYWKELVEEGEKGEEGTVCREQEALQERLRTATVTGVTDYSFSQLTGHILFSAGSKLFLCQDTCLMEEECVLRPTELSLELPKSSWPMNVTPCPADPLLIAFLCNSDIYLYYKGVTVRGTFSSKKEACSAGTPSFVMQEEFDRFTGIWWAPSTADAAEDGDLWLLYEEVDESGVVEVSLSCPGSIVDSAEIMRYPLTGTANAKSTLKMLQVRKKHSLGNNQLDVTDLCLSVDLNKKYPWFEYIVRAGWTPDGVAVWAQLLSRKQDHTALVYLPRFLFANSNEAELLSDEILIKTIVTLYEEHSDVWISVHNLTQFISTSQPEHVRFIYSSEKHGFSHLYLSEIKIENDVAAQVNERVITSGEWPVAKKAGIVVDEKRGHVYFVASKSSPIDTNVCVASYLEPSECRLLTESGSSYRSDRADQRLHVQPDLGFISCVSSIHRPPICVFYKLFHDEQDLLPFARPLYQLTYSLPPHNTSTSSPDTDCPMDIPIELASFPKTDKEGSVEILSYMSAVSGQTHYAMLMRPANCQSDHSYPVIQYVYGGPGIQLVKNSWGSWCGLVKYTSAGFAVVIVDGRGSNNRGLGFQSPMKHSMGTFEIVDQVEGLLAVAAQTGHLLDLNRVAICGASYGGYVSLLAMAQRPDIYKVSIASSPVTCWLLYDTGYTERYMGLPKEQPEAYIQGSVLQQVANFPSTPDRLMIMHGLVDENVHFRHTEKLIDALIKAGKPHRLQVFPRERHGVRANEANELMDATVLHFISKNIGGSRCHV